MINLIKKITLFFGLSCVFVFTLMSKNIVHASNDTIKVNFIFDQLTYIKGDYIHLNINISNLDKVSEIKMGINNSEDFKKFVEFLEPVGLESSSGFNDIFVNEINEEKGLRAHFQKSGDVLQNSLGNLTFISVKDISDIISVISKELTLYLFDENNELLEYQIVFSEKLKATWNILLDEIEVYMSVPDYKSSFFVLNRKEEEYQIIVKETIDSSVIGTQVYSIVVLDKVNNDELLFSKAINVADKTVPCITYPDVININDKELGSFNLDNYIQIDDNYDDNAKLYYSYYNKDGNKIDSFSLFKEYLNNNSSGNITFYGIDNSGNKTEVMNLSIDVKDTTPPVISTLIKETIVIKDTELENFNLSSIFNINDEYDVNPLLVVEVYDSNNVVLEDYKKKLVEGEMLEVRYYGVDNSNNKSKVYTLKIVLEDTTAPMISGVTDMEINDSSVNDDFYLDGLLYSDNIDKAPTLDIVFYIGEEKVNKYLFLEKIKKGLEGCVSFQVIDKSNNKSEVHLRRIKVIDTTAPIIKLVDLKDGGKYIKVEDIKYEVEDNFLGSIDIYIEVDGDEYQNTLINEIGKHTVVIYAKDESGNVGKKEFSFTIIENNINGCSGDIKCYVDNYLNVIIVVSVLTLVCVALVVVKFITLKKKEKTKVKDIKEDKI